jgi:hypothetical protein
MQCTTLRRIAGALRLPLALATIAVLAFPSVARAQGPSPKLSPQLDSVRTGLDKYQDPMVAVADGYLSTVACIDFPKGHSEGTMQYVAGGMGVHFLNLSYIGPTLDPMKPQVLIYEPDGDKLKLVAAEWFAPVAAVGNTPPSVFGKPLEGPMEGHPPIMPPGLHHYDLHVWLWKANPAGVYSPTNPDLKCPKSGYSFSGDAPKMVGGHAH